MTELPHAEEPFTGVINPLVKDSTPAKPSIDYPPAGAPNVVVVLLDDVGFGTASTFGGPVPTPALDRIADSGLRYNQFHTTALCSPTRAALLTGRNHHSAHMGAICEIAYGFPGYDSVIPQSTATVAQTLRLNGYSTSWFGKAHITPMWELSPAGPFDRWPTGLGFDRFYGFLGGETSQYEPALYDQTTPVEPYVGREDYHLTEDLADKAIEWIRLQKTSAPDKPFFTYFAPGAAHCPHHVWPEWSDRFKGQFDDGWDALRQKTYDRQLEAGIIPPGTRLTPRPEEIPAWADYDDRYKPVASRLMEVFAGFMAHTDAQVGRLIDAIDQLGQLDNTLFIYVCGDNGASAEGTLHGCWSAPSYQNGIPEDPEWLLDHIDDFGTVRCENHYNVGWAWALDAPFQWMKQVASHFGGTRNGVAISWPKGIEAAGEQRSQFHHVIDLAPTILDAAGIPQPDHVNGIEQRPIEGVSMRYSFDDPSAPSTRTTQYFEMFGNRAIYHDGWIASCFHGRLPWVRAQAVPFGDTERWELYNIADDFSQGVDLAEQFAQRRDVEVTLEQRRKHAVLRIGRVQQLPDLGQHVFTVGVDAQVVVLAVVAGNVCIQDPVGRDTCQVVMCIETVIDAVDENVVDVEVKTAIGLVDHGIEEFEFAHLARGGGIGRDVLHADAAFEYVLDVADARGDIVHRLGGERDRHQVVQLSAVTAIRKVFGVDACLMGIEKRLEFTKKTVIERGRSADR